MALHSVLKARGLNVGDNQLGLPEGTLARANNVVTPFRDVLESRRGQKFLDYTFGGGSSRSNEGVFYQSALVIQYGTSLAHDTGATFTAYSGSYSGPDETLLRMKFVEAALNLYFTTSIGVYLLDAIGGTPERAGIPKPIHMTGNTDTLCGTWLESDQGVGYVAVLGKKDANGNVKLGAPGPRFVVSNYIRVATAALARTAPDGSHPAGKVTATYSGFLTAGTSLRAGDVLTLDPGEADFTAGDKTVVTAVGSSFTYNQAGAVTASTVPQNFFHSTGVQLSVKLPSDATATHFLRLYRTEQLPAENDPGEEYFQAYEVNLSASDILGGSVAISDVAPDSMLGAPLYTNELTGDGIGAANERPPIAKDVCQFDDRVWYFNTTDKHRLHLQVLGTGSPGGLQTNDTLTLAGRTYTFKTSGVAGVEQVQIGTTGTPAQRVEETARNFVAKINDNPNNTTVYAFYESGINEPPGRFLVEERAVGGSAFTVYGSRVSAWAPAITTGSTGATSSSNDRRPHGASYAKRGQPEAVPLTNWVPVGAANQQILRAIPLRDKIFVFTETGRIWTISGTYPYRVDALDGTAEIIGPDTAVEHANQIFCLTTQGVCAVSDAGVKILSTPTEPELLELFGSALSTLKRRAFGVSYESDRQYQLWLPSESDDTCATQALIYNSLYGTWTRWTGSRTWGRVNKATGLLMLGEGEANKVRVERKGYTREDFADESLAVTIVSSTGKVVTLASAAGITAGDLLYQSDDVKALVSEVDEDADTVTVLTTETWAAAAATVMVAIDNDWKWATASPGGPGLMKQFRAASFHFRSWYVNTFTAVFDSDLNSTESTVLLSSPGFGLTAFGSGLFGQEIGAKNKLAAVPKENSITTQIRVGGRVREAWSIWTLHGYSLTYEAVAEGSGR